MSLNIIDLMIGARDILADDTAIKAWCQQEFSKDPAISLGINEKLPPEQWEYPMVALVDVRSSAVTRGNKRTFEMIVGFGVVQATVSQVENVTTFDGLVKVEQLRELGELALLRGFNNPYMHFDGYTRKNNIYPIFISYTVLALEEIQSRRHRRFT